jgi:hypothetical protein
VPYAQRHIRQPPTALQIGTVVSARMIALAQRGGQQAHVQKAVVLLVRLVPAPVDQAQALVFGLPIDLVVFVVLSVPLEPLREQYSGLVRQNLVACLYGVQRVYYHMLHKNEHVEGWPFHTGSKTRAEGRNPWLLFLTQENYPIRINTHA